MQKHAHKTLTDNSLQVVPQRNRTERRREDARRRLMKATYEIVAQRGLDGLIVQDITEAADVGYGSFYNHFPSKDAILEAVNHAANDYSKEVCRQIAELGFDRTERFVMNLRMSLHLIKTDKVWGWYLIRTMLSKTELRSSIGGDLRQAITAGLNQGAFRHDDPEMAYETVAGLLLLGTLKLVSAEVPQDYSDRLLRTAFKSLGWPETKIDNLLQRPLPDLHLPPFLEAAG